MPTGNPLISVVIPAYNEEKYLPACLSAFRKQTFKDFELIVVDNNSTDKTVEIARSFGARVIHELQQGMIPARERGYREARCDIIARTDADTTVPPDWLDIVYNTFKTHPHAVALMGTLHSPYKKVPHWVFKHYTTFWFVTLGKLLSGHTLLIGPNMALRKSAWEKVKVHMDDKLVHEDIDLACHLAEIGEILFVPHLPVPISLRRIHEDPLRGTTKYIGEYPIRYFRTILLHNPRFKYLVSKKFKLSKNYTLDDFWSFVKKREKKITKKTHL